MDKKQFARVSEAIASAILEREQVHPVFLERHTDNSFTATFDDVIETDVRQNIEECDKTIVVLDSENLDARQPDKIHKPTSVHFAFTSKPEIDLS